MSDEPSCSNDLDPQLPRCAWLLACSVSREDASPQSSASARRIPGRILSGNGVHRFRNHCSTSPEYAAFAGLAIGDALGTTLEFMPRDQYEPLQDIIGGGPFQLRAGEWTDDTSMALCLADSLLCCRQHNPIDQLERYSRWRAEGENSVNGRCFDIGRTVSKALREFKGSSSPYPGGQDHYSAGNGSLMRLAPLVLFYSTHVSTRDTASAIVHLLEMSAFSSMTTHRHPLAVREGANKRGNSSRLTQSFHFFMFEPIFSPVNALNQPI